MMHKDNALVSDMPVPTHCVLPAGFSQAVTVFIVFTFIKLQQVYVFLLSQCLISISL